MSDVIDQRDCLNCGAPLGGKYCGRCGQRNIAAYPSAWELFGDAWQELAGYDGRFLRTLRALLRRPGVLFIAQYALRAFHRVYRNGWLLTAVKIVGVAAVYGALFVPAMTAALIWAARSR